MDLVQLRAAFLGWVSVIPVQVDIGEDNAVSPCYLPLMTNYAAYGLKIDSTLHLPELPAVDGGPDVIVRFSKEEYPLPDAGDEGLIHATGEEALLYFGTVGHFSVREGREIVISPVPNAHDRSLRLVVLGAGLGTILYQRGLLTLHASAVATAGGAVAFMAERGLGKSTTAAAMYSRGYWLIADDITALRFGSSDRPTVVPGYPQLKLWPEAAAFLGDAPQKLPKLHPDFTKRARPVTAAFSTTPLPLERIYVLRDGKVPEIQPLSPQEALASLISCTYGQRLFQAVRTSSHFFQCAEVVNSVPMRSLKRPHSLAELPEVVQLIEEDLAQSI
jgi:hypothetical protein